MKRLAIVLALLVAGCSGPDFRAFEFTGGDFGPDGEFYHLEAHFFPSAEGCDMLTIKQPGGEYVGGGIIRLGNKNEATVIDPVIVVYQMKDGGIVRKVADYVIIDEHGQWILVGTYPTNRTYNLSVRFERGDKMYFDLYDKK